MKQKPIRIQVRCEKDFQVVAERGLLTAKCGYVLFFHPQDGAEGEVFNPQCYSTSGGHSACCHAYMLELKPAAKEDAQKAIEQYYKDLYDKGDPPLAEMYKLVRAFVYRKGVTK